MTAVAAGETRLASASREDLTTHDLRHHFAAQLYAKTGKLTAVQQALGHRNITTTARYAHLTDTAEQNAFATIHRLINTLHVDLRRI